MAVNNELVKFLYGATGTPSTKAGEISFHSGNQAIYVGDGSTAQLVTSSVKDATFVDNVLTITKVNGGTVTLDFSDVASADQTGKILGRLRTDVNANAEQISSLDDKVDALDASYKAADKAINDKIGTVAEGKTVVGLIEEAKAAANAAHTVVAKDSSFLTINTTTAENGAVTYTLGTSDVASAIALNDVSTLLAEVKNTADAAQTADEVSTAISTAIDALAGSAEDTDDSSFVKVAVATENGEVKTITVTTSDIASAATLNDVKGRLDTFLNGADLNSTVDTLKEIQEWINGDGVNATELTEAIAAEAKLRGDADTSLGNRIKAVEDDYLKSSDKTELTNAINGVSAVANAAAVKTTTDSSLALKADASTVYTKTETYTKTEVDGLVAGANTNASTAESNAKTYADAIKVNGQTQSGQEITLTGVNIKVGGTDTHKDASLSTAVEDLYTKVQAASEAGVQSLAVNTDSSKYAEVDKAKGAVTLKIKKVALVDASETNTGVADAYDVKTSIETAKSEAISAVQGSADDAATAATVAGAKKYADAQIEAAALRWGTLN